MLIHVSQPILGKLVTVLRQRLVHAKSARVVLVLIELVSEFFLQRMHGILPAGVSGCTTVIDFLGLGFSSACTALMELVSVPCAPLKAELLKNSLTQLLVGNLRTAAENTSRSNRSEPLG